MEESSGAQLARNGTLMRLRCAVAARDAAERLATTTREGRLLEGTADGS
jgi:hypothetical protein